MADVSEDNRFNILIIDDEPLLRDYLASLLRPYNVVEVAHASSVKRAEELLNSRLFNLIFIDIQLKNENGLDCMPRLQKISKQSDFVVISAHSSIDNARKAIANGAKGFVVKPFTTKKIEGIMKTINRLVS